jgi:hypothetical protein
MDGARRRMLALVVAVAVLVAAAVALRSRSGDDARTPSLPAATPGTAATPAPDPTPDAFAVRDGRPGLAVGLTEPDPSLVSPAADVPAPYAQWRDQVAAIRPAVYRLVVDWSLAQPTQAAAPDLDRPVSGCLRDRPPCRGWGGIDAQLRALAARQRADGGWQGLVVVLHTPDWAATPADRCSRKGTEPRERMPVPGALDAYKALVAAVARRADAVGASLRYWSPWNEPNHPAFLTTPCGTSAAAAYAPIAEAMGDELRALGGDRRLVLGETAGLLRSGEHVTAVGPFVRGLPADLVCAAGIWSQHAYVGGPDPVPAVAAALDAKGCPTPDAIWIGETGVGPAPRALSSARPIDDPAAGCRALHDRLVRWWRDPRVTLAVQYTAREDDRFPTGLVSTDLTTARPVLPEWQAWGGARAATAAPPADACPAG